MIFNPSDNDHQCQKRTASNVLKTKGGNAVKLTENEAKGVSEWSLTPNEAPRVDRFGGAVDISTADPGRCHREYPDKQADRTTS